MSSKYTLNQTLGALRAAVENKEVEITLVIGPPRTVTTTLAGALGQSEDVGVQHVFHEKFTYSKYAPIMKFLQNPNRKKPQHIVIKEMAYTSCNKELMELSEHVVFTTREPLQLAMAKQEPKSRGARNIRHVGLEDLPKWRWNKSTVEDQTTRGIKKLRETFSSTNLHHTYNKLCTASSLQQEHGKPQVSVVDGDIFRMMPDDILHQLADKSGICYDSKMVDGWQNVHKTPADSWCKTYKKSSGIQRPKQITPYADGIYDHLDYASCASYYAGILASEHAVLPSGLLSLRQALKAMEEHCEVTESEMRFDDMAPPTAYAYIAGYPTKDAKEQVQQSEYLQDLRARHLEHQDGFDILDTEIARARAPKTVLELNKTHSHERIAEPEIERV